MYTCTSLVWYTVYIIPTRNLVFNLLSQPILWKKRRKKNIINSNKWNGCASRNVRVCWFPRTNVFVESWRPHSFNAFISLILCPMPTKSLRLEGVYMIVVKWFHCQYRFVKIQNTLETTIYSYYAPLDFGDYVLQIENTNVENWLRIESTKTSPNCRSQFFNHFWIGLNSQLHLHSCT